MKLVRNISIAWFCRERNREMEIWNGYRAGIDGAVDDYEADEAYAIDLLDEEIIAKILNKEKLFYRIGQRADFDAKVSTWITKANESGTWFWRSNAVDST